MACHPAFSCLCAQVGKAVGSEGLVAGQVVDIKSEGAGTSVGIETLQVRGGATARVLGRGSSSKAGVLAGCMGRCLP